MTRHVRHRVRGLLPLVVMGSLLGVPIPMALAVVGNPANADAIAELDQAGAFLGNSVAVAGDVNGDGYDDVIVAAPGYDLGGSIQGAAFVFHGGPDGAVDGSPATIDGVLQTDQPEHTLDVVVAAAGDVNGDGYDDVVVGDEGYALGETTEGAAFVFHGGPAGVGHRLMSDADAIIESNQAGAHLGSSAAGAGDVNGDGYDDVVVGVESYDSTVANEGAVLVFHGGPSGVGDGTPANADAFLRSNQGLSVFGASVAGAGDVNRDGFADVVAGARLYDSGQTNEGLAFVFHGGPAGIGSGIAAIAADAVLQSNQANAQFGASVAGAGDTNHDRYDDVVVGAPFFSSATGTGAAFVFHGGSSGVGSGDTTGADGAIWSEIIGSSLGNNVAGAGDTNGDGYADVVVAVPSIAAVLVYRGRAEGVGTRAVADADQFLRSDVTNSQLGVSLGGAGDTNGDGYDDAVAGDNTYTSGEASEGAAYVFLGRPDGSDTIGVYVAASGAWFLRDANSPGGADVVFTFGAAGGGSVVLRGDWDGDGADSPGLYTPATGAFFLRNDASPGSADVVFTFGAANAGFVPIVGDWNADGVDTVGLYAPSTSTFFLRNQNAAGAADLAFSFGPAGAGWRPIAGDWDGVGSDTVGLYDPVTSTFFLRNTNGPGGADSTFGFGPAGSGWLPVAGDFDGDGDTTVGLYDATAGVFFLRNLNTPGAADLTFGYGPSGVTPLVGDWNGSADELAPRGAARRIARGPRTG